MPISIRLRLTAKRNMSFTTPAQKHVSARDERDQRLISYAVHQERDRLAKQQTINKSHCQAHSEIFNLIYLIGT